MHSAPRVLLNNLTVISYFKAFVQNVSRKAAF